MKTRMGFVSNSSTTSFFISIDDFKSTIELSEHLLLCLVFRSIYHQEVNREKMDDWLKNKDKHSEEDILELQTSIDERKSHIEEITRDFYNKLMVIQSLAGNPNIAFDSIMFPTLITKVTVNNKDYYYVAACDNVDWEIDRVTPDGLDSDDIWAGIYNDSFIKGKTFHSLDTNKSALAKENYKIEK